MRASITPGARHGSRAGTSVEATARVQGTPTDSQAIVELHDGTYATVTSAALFPEIAAPRLFAKGMRIAGRHYPRDRRFELGDHVPPAEVRLAELQNDDVLPVLVSSVAASDCVVQVLPNSSVTIPREQVTGNPLDDLSDLLSPGEIVLARVLRDGADLLALSMLDVDETDDVRAALAVWPGGPGWLEWPPPLVAASDFNPVRLTADAAIVTEQVASTSVAPTAAPPIVADREPAAPAVTPRPSPLLLDPTRRVAPVEAPGATVPAPTPSPAVRELSLSLAAARSSSAMQEARADAAEARSRPLTVELQRIEVEAAELRRQLDRKEKELADLKTRHRTTLNKERKGIEASDLAAFLDPEEDFRWEVLTSWARRIPAGEKPSLPLPDYRLGQEFLVSLDEIHGISRRKVADVVVEVLTGRAESNPSRGLHPLRSGAGGDDLPVRRDGASCWRVSLQTNTPSARRLHFWRSADHIELSRVVMHDDFRP